MVGDEAKIVEFRIFHIGGFGGGHDGTGISQTREKRHTQHNDEQDSDIPPKAAEMLRRVFFLSAFVMRFPAPFALPFNLFHGRDVLVHANGVNVAAFYAYDAVCHGGKRRIVRDDDDGHAVAAAGILQKL